jgi:uncharacterized membrane protein
MTSSNTGNPSDRIAALRKREQALKAAIAAEQIKRQKREQRIHARLVEIIGEALLQNAAKHPDFEAMLKSILKTTTTIGDSEKKLLREKGWL